MDIIDNPRRIFFTDFNIEKCDSAIRTILNINEADELCEKTQKNYVRQPIEIYISSYGGQVYPALGLISVIKDSKTPIHTICTGHAMSCGFMLLISGHKRFAYEYATAMYHQVSSFAFGELERIKDDLQEGQRLQTILETIVLEKTKISQKMLNDIRTQKVDKFFNVKECLALGIIDAVKKR